MQLPISKHHISTDQKQFWRLVSTPANNCPSSPNTNQLDNISFEGLSTLEDLILEGWKGQIFCFCCKRKQQNDRFDLEREKKSAFAFHDRRFLKETAINFDIGGVNHDLLIFAEMKSCAISLQGTPLSVWWTNTLISRHFLRKPKKKYFFSNIVQNSGTLQILGDIFVLKIEHTLSNFYMKLGFLGQAPFPFWKHSNFTWCHLQWGSWGSCPSDATKRTCWRMKVKKGVKRETIWACWRLKMEIISSLSDTPQFINQVCGMYGCIASWGHNSLALKKGQSIEKLAFSDIQISI